MTKGISDVIYILLNDITGYTFLGDPSVALSAAVSTRYTSSSLKGILSDIHLLSKSDYLVCTFSSQVFVDKFYV